MTERTCTNVLHLPFTDSYVQGQKDQTGKKVCHDFSAKSDHQSWKRFQSDWNAERYGKGNFSWTDTSSEKSATCPKKQSHDPGSGVCTQQITKEHIPSPGQTRVCVCLNVWTLEVENYNAREKELRVNVCLLISDAKSWAVWYKMGQKQSLSSVI